MKDNSYNTTDIPKNISMSGQFSNEKFNQEFFKNSSRDKMEIVEYKDPIPTSIKQSIAYSGNRRHTKGRLRSSNTTTDNICYTDAKGTYKNTYDR